MGYLISSLPLIVTLLLGFIFISKLGFRRGYMLLLPLMLWLPYIAPYPLHAVARFFHSEDISLVELIILIPFGMLLLGKDKGLNPQAFPNMNWFWLFLTGGVVSFLFGFLFYPLPDFNLDDGLSFFRQICLVSFALYYVVLNLINTTDAAEKSMIAMLIGSVILSVFIIGNIRPEVYIYSVGDALVGGSYLLHFDMRISIGGNSGSIYYLMIAILSLNLWLSGSTFAKRIIGFACFSISFSICILLATRAIWIISVPAIVFSVLISRMFCRISYRKMIATIGIPLILVAGLFAARLFGEYMQDKASVMKSREAI